MMSSEDRTLEDLLYGGSHGDEMVGAELGQAGALHSAEEAATLTALPLEKPMVCAGCGEQVCDRFFLLAVGQVWHGTCLRCSRCHCELQTHHSLYWRDGRIYCQQDYCRLFGIGRCARCSEPIPSSAMVMRSGELTFHPQCFSCQECDVLLTPGNLYCMQGQSVYCQSHYHDDGNFPRAHTPHIKPNLREEGEDSISGSEPWLDDQVPGARRKTKRMRTCFRSEQLRALESYFAQKHNPDGKDWTCLTHKTGLPKRVLQVWFQNARAKLRRSLSADDSQSNSPAAPSRPETMATISPTCSPGQSHTSHTSTIDQLELSLLTAPLSDPSGSPDTDQWQGLKDSFFQNYDSQVSGYASPLVSYGDYGDSRGGEHRDDNSDSVNSDITLQPYYC